jgi:hypothetical protein
LENIPYELTDCVFVGAQPEHSFSSWNEGEEISSLFLAHIPKLAERLNLLFVGDEPRLKMKLQRNFKI